MPRTQHGSAKILNMPLQKRVEHKRQTDQCAKQGRVGLG